MTTIAPPAEAHRIQRAEAPAVAAAEYGRFLELLRSLREDDWTRPTDCDRWDVRGIVAHVVGWAETLTMRQFIRLSRLGKPVARELGSPPIDGMNEVLVRQRKDMSPTELVTRLEKAVPHAVASRSSLSAPLRHMPISTPEGRITLGYLNDHIFTRDVWIHRVDINRATGRQMIVTPEHDSRIVADIVADWIDRHRRAVTLVLEGPAGGVYQQGSDGEEHRLDAVDFCRIVSGRAEGAGLLATTVLF